MTAKAHPFAGKLTADQAAEVRSLRHDGVPIAELSARFGVAKSSVSAIVKYKAHEPAGTLRISLLSGELDLLRELAEDESVPIEDIAASILCEALRGREW